MADKEPLGLPFDHLQEFKESMRRGLGELFNDSINSSLDLESADKENSISINDSVAIIEDSNAVTTSVIKGAFSLNDSNSEDDILLSTILDRITKPPSPKKKTTRKSRYNTRSNQRKTRSQVETILVGDAEESDEENCATRTRTRRKSQPLISSQAETLLVGDAEASDEENYVTPSKITRSGRKSQPKVTKSNVIINDSNNIIAIDDDDDDDDEECGFVETSSSTMKNKFSKIDDFNEEVNVKIKWLFDGPITLKLGKFEPFSKLYQKLAEIKKVNKDCIVLYKDGDVRIDPEETPDSINLNILDILSGYTLKEPVKNTTPTASEKKRKNANVLEVKVITDSKRDKEMLFSLNRNQKMYGLFFKVAEQLNYNVDDVQLWFDGEKVCDDDTTADLDLEGGECFELKLKS